MLTARLVMTLLIWSIILFTGSMYGKSAKHHQRHTHRPTPINRKFNTSAFFHSIANTCAQAGNTVGAQTEQEKQQAACNLVGSIFQTAAVLSEKTNKRSTTISSTSPAAIRAVLAFLHTLPPVELDQLLAPNYAYLQAAIALTTKKEQEQFITQTLTNKEEGKVFLDELFSLFKVLVDDQVPLLLDTLHQEALKNLNLN